MSTTKTMRRQRPQAFFEYTLSRMTSPEIGLTNVPFGKMTQVIGPNVDNTEATVDLGQQFSFDGMQYGHAIVSSNGYVALGVASSTSILTASVSDNSLIPVGSITPSGSVLFAPWFNDLQTATASNASYPGVWFAKDHGPDGVRSIFRWVCQNVVTANSPKHILTFECILCSNGEIQFRYAPTITVGTVTESDVGSVGATMGVFATGSFRFRDFSRNNTEYGGAVYDSSYSDPAQPSAVYTTSLVSTRDWPAARFGALHSFQPRRSVRRVVPRLALRIADQHASQYTTQRPGSHSRRATTTLFDDRKSIAFTSGVVNFPTRLPRWALASMPGGHTIGDLYTDMQVTASVSQNAVESWLETRTVDNSTRISPFSEVGQPEQDYSTAEFFATGTQPGDAPGLSSQLRSKTIIRIDMPVEFVTTLSQTTASLYCYNASSMRMQLVASASRQAPSTNIGLACDTQLFGPLGHAVLSGAHSNAAGGISVSPFYVSNQSTFAQITKPVVETALQFLQTGSATLNQLYDPLANDIIPMSAGLFIDQPFLIEKAVIELPLAAGPGWFNDRTRTVLNNIPTASVAPNIVNYKHSVDLGGPCLTFGILNCISPNKRDIILSGTIVPVGDTSVSSTFSYVNNVVVNAVTKSLYEQSIEGFTGYGCVPSAVVRQNASNNTSFTGTVRMQTDARVLNGYLVHMYDTYAPYASSSAAWLANVAANNVIDIAQSAYGSTLHNVSPFCRNMAGFDPSGRSLYGKEYTAPAYAQNTLFGITNPFAQVSDQAVEQLDSGAQFTGSYVVFPNVAAYVGNSRPSPYLIRPTDKLAFVLAKHRPAKSATSRTACSTFSNLYADSNAGVLTGSHDVQIMTGTIRITLYGTHLAAGVEHNDALYQQLNSAAVSETIAGGEAITDQYEVEYRDSLSGSIADAYMTGTLVSMPSYKDSTAVVGRLTIGSRERAFSITNARAAGLGALSNTSLSKKLIPAWEVAGDIRHVQCVSMTERVYDSMLPAFDSISRADGAQLVSYADADYVTGSWAFFESHGATSISGDVPLQATNNNWMWAYPFEPRYAGISRQTDIVSSFVTKGDYDGTDIQATDRKPASSLTVAVGYKNPDLVLDTFAYHITVDYVSSGAIENCTSAPSSDVIKMLYGFGDANLRSKFGTFAMGPTHFPTTRQTPVANSVNRSVLHYGVSPVIRGWKYGLANGLPQHSRAIFRRSTYGQFRDMLEQRLDTKYFVEIQSRGGAPTVTTAPVRVNFVDSDGRTTKPENTWSQNLSFEATSSLPFFDGVQRNRPAPNINILNMGTIALRTDTFGNVTL